MGTGGLGRRGALRSALIAVAAAALTCSMAAGASAASGPRAAAAKFSAHGSVGQVYVTGLAPSARMSLLNRAGRTISTKRADSLGGLLFRNVKPGTGYRVRLSKTGAKSGPLKVLSTRSAPPSANVYNQAIPA